MRTIKQACVWVGVHVCVCGVCVCVRMWCACAVLACMFTCMLECMRTYAFVRVITDILLLMLTLNLKPYHAAAAVATSRQTRNHFHVNLRMSFLLIVRALLLFGMYEISPPLTLIISLKSLPIHLIFKALLERAKGVESFPGTEKAKGVYYLLAGVLF